MLFKTYRPALFLARLDTEQNISKTQGFNGGFCWQLHLVSKQTFGSLQVYSHLMFRIVGSCVLIDSCHCKSELHQQSLQCHCCALRPRAQICYFTRMVLYVQHLVQKSAISNLFSSIHMKVRFCLLYMVILVQLLVIYNLQCETTSIYGHQNSVILL